MESGAIRVNARITIPVREIEFSFARSGGPGGQNVNKVASKAVLRFNLRRSPAIPEPARARALARLASRLTRDGELVLSSSVFRDQARNRAAVLKRFQALLAEAVRVPRKRLPTRPSASSREHRLAAKKARGQLKRERKPLPEE